MNILSPWVYLFFPNVVLKNIRPFLLNTALPYQQNYIFWCICVRERSIRYGLHPLRTTQNGTVSMVRTFHEFSKAQTTRSQRNTWSQYGYLCLKTWPLSTGTFTIRLKLYKIFYIKICGRILPILRARKQNQKFDYSSFKIRFIVY